MHLDGHKTTQTSRRTNRHIDIYIESPDEQTDWAFLFPLLLSLLLLAPVYSNLAIAGQVGMLRDKAAAITESESINNLCALVG